MLSLGRWLGISDSQKKTIKDEVDIMGAISAHVNWKQRLEKCLNGDSDEKLDPMIVCRDDQCALGKWIHGEAVKHFHGHEEFHNLRSDHAQFHFIAGSVVKKVEENDRAGAEQLLNNEYAHVSRNVVNSLIELNKQVVSG